MRDLFDLRGTFKVTERLYEGDDPAAFVPLRHIGPRFSLSRIPDVGDEIRFGGIGIIGSLAPVTVYLRKPGDDTWSDIGMMPMGEVPNIFAMENREEGYQAVARIYPAEQADAILSGVPERDVLA